MTNLTPNRVVSIDIIRGFALLGIFFVNVPSMFYPDMLTELTYTGGEAFVRLLYDIFIQTKFYTIFSFLFGVSAFYFMRNQERKGLSYKKLFRKRVAWLLLFGIFHFVFIWAGDILHTYALIGFLLPFFYSKSPKKIFTWAIVLFSIYFILMTFTHTETSTDTPAFMTQTAFLNANGEVNFYHNYFAQVSERLTLLSILLPFEIITALEILPLFLLGFGLAKMNFFENFNNYKVLVKKVAITAFILSLPFIALMIYEFTLEKPASFYYVFVSGKLLAIVYISLLLFACENTILKQKLSPLASYGKMAFTNYLCQSLLTLLVVSLFVNDTGNISLGMQSIFCIIFLSLQVYFSNIIMKSRKYGPFEYIWRKLIFGKNKRIKMNA